MTVHVVGGVYHEFCAWPEHEALMGSAGRAALCMAQLDIDFQIHLHCRLNKSDETTLKEVFVFNSNSTLNVDFCEETTKFEYFHPLSEPRIKPALKESPLPIFEPKISNTDSVILFGMVDCVPKIDCETVVYDPQNTYQPMLFSETGSSAKNLAYVINRNELTQLFRGKNDWEASLEEMGEWLREYESAELVVVKCGEKGAFVISSNERGWVCPYKTQSVFPIGSGDSFVAAFSYYWLQKEMSPMDAAEKASVAAAYYVSHRTMNTAEGLEEFRKTLEPLAVDKKPKVYLAGPFFTLAELWMVNEAKHHIESFGMEVFSPYHEIGIGSAEEVVKKDIDAIEECDAMYAIFNGTDPGTLFEIGYAISRNKPVIILAENPKDEELKMYDGSGCKIFQEFASSIYCLSWLSS